MDFLGTPVDCVAVSIIREGDMVSISYMYDLREATRSEQAALDLYFVAAQTAVLLDVPLFVEAN